MDDPCDEWAAPAFLTWALVQRDRKEQPAAEEISREDPAIRVVREADPDGCAVEHGQALDILDRMLDRGTITADMRDAGRQFQQDFFVGAMHTMPLSRLEWSPASGRSDITDTQCDARRRLGKAMSAMGGFGAPAACAAWYVLGAGLAVNDFARRGLWHNQQIDRRTAGGMLIAALAVLATHYRPARRSESTRDFAECL